MRRLVRLLLFSPFEKDERQPSLHANSTRSFVRSFERLVSGQFETSDKSLFRARTTVRSLLIYL